MFLLRCSGVFLVKNKRQGVIQICTLDFCGATGEDFVGTRHALLLLVPVWWQNAHLNMVARQDLGLKSGPGFALAFSPLK